MTNKEDSNSNLIRTIEIDAGDSRKYYFDIRESKDGDKFLTITEYKYNKWRKKRKEILVWYDHANKFSKALQKAVAEIQGIAEHQCEAGTDGFCLEPTCGKFLH